MFLMVINKYEKAISKTIDYYDERIEAIKNMGN